MRGFRLTLLLAVSAFLGGSGGILSAAEPAAKDVEFFEKHVRPVLVQHCYKCHSADAKEVEGGLLLDTRAGVRKGGESGPAVKPGDPNASLLLKAVRYTDKNLKMPPAGQLPAGAIADLETWVRSGAADPREGPVSAIAKKGADPAARDHWSFQPVKAATAPRVADENWPYVDVDRFVLAELEKQGLHPVGDAEPAALVRRLYYDLIGLPPPPEEVERLARDPSPAAVEKLADKLLASPQFGERWGRHWLDVARYGESNGNTDNFLFPYAWRYRDYVIAAFNADTPFDRFVQEQIAGDLLPAKNSQERDKNLIATGFLALASKPRKQNNPDYEMDLVADQIEVTTTGVMGLTVACARCHDHKFDPIGTKEYYGLAGIFTSSQVLHSLKGGEGKNATKATTPTGLHTIGSDAGSSGGSEIARKLAAAQERLSELHQAASAGNGALKLAAAAKLTPAQLAALDKTAKKKLRQGLKDGGQSSDGKLPATGNSAPVESLDPKQLAAEIQMLEAELDKLRAESPQAAGYAMGVREGKAADCALCLRGESKKRGEVVPRGFIQCVHVTPELHVNKQQSGRLELAHWLTRSENPLTARVYANRVWQHLFGEGLVRTPDNFGNLGERPSHPELLDYLATYLMDHGWSTKQLIRALVLTRTYRLGGTFNQRSYDADPENRLLWRQSPRRLDAEAIRDGMLAVSGQLELQPLAGSVVESSGEQEAKNALAERFIHTDNKHRSVYLPAVRNAPPEMMGLFDSADSSLIVGARSVTTVPAQALFLMNSPFVQKNAQAAADELLKSPGDDAALLDLVFLRAYSRKPSSQERERLLEYLTKASNDAAGKSAGDGRRAAWTNVWQTVLSAAEFRYLN